MKGLKQLKLLVSLLCLVEAGAVLADERGLQIAQEADRRNTGWQDMAAELLMELRNAYGATSSRELEVQFLEVQGDGDKSLARFLSPADVRGTTLLTHAHSLQSDDQWQYFPSLRRVKRIASENKSGPFMGSEFAYEDMASWELDKYSYEYLGDEEVEGQQAYRLQMVPAYPRSGYTRQVTWLDKAHYRPLKVEYYDRKNALLKTQTYQDYQVYGERYWRAGQMRMVNHQTGKQTLMRWSNYRFGNGYDALTFDRSSLEARR
ncbi:membrane protein [Pseudomonas sp. PAGU 2196]|uniref:outer membrane lipoprotein-sorting protein n=1 Tax=Pseudomonas sp. PAGU 2196 TaxID=2793997 RepID=UPI001EDD1F4B|nr:outer membrane lipoprotein-sorting protein [Pseudomonas sp. PAGU 2196]GHS79630.1 membrane protein [Pseudomonas sp. PAGU 2196]